MSTDLPDYEARFKEAIDKFWFDRAGQTARQRARGLSDAGTRGSVTGGTHLHAVRDLIHQVIRDAGMEPSQSNTLPGYYRRAKNWDTVVMYHGAVVAIVELKSQVGSFGNNFNNRVEEVVGQSLDIWRSTREELLGPVRPWFGFVMVLEDHEKSRRAQTSRDSALPFDPAFAGASYIKQYQIALGRLRLEGDVSSVCLATTSNTPQTSVAYPDLSMSFSVFANSLRLRIQEARLLVDSFEK